MARKKWRLKYVPTFRYESCQSQVAAYRRVKHYEELRAEGMCRITQVNVEVDEGNGWRLFERVVFPS